MHRRDFLWQSGGGLGGVALAALLGADGLLAADASGGGARLRPDGGVHHAPRARRVVQLFMAGAASHIDLFDFKPELIKRHGQPCRLWRASGDVSGRARSLAASRSSTSGLMAHAARCWATPSRRWGRWLTTSRSSITWSASPACTARRRCCRRPDFNRPGFPSAGCWVSYGLGRLTDNLPTFVVLPDHRGLASNGTKNWDSAFLLVAVSGHGHLIPARRRRSPTFSPTLASSFSPPRAMPLAWTCSIA